MPLSVRRAARQELIDRRLTEVFFDDRPELNRYRNELRSLWGEIERARDRFYEEFCGFTARGHPASFGHLAPDCAPRLYALIRKLKPTRLVETGVCNGVSTWMILAALEANGSGQLWSIDYPEYSDGSVTDFSETKGGAIVPAGRLPGWLVPDALRPRWELIVGKSQIELPTLLERLDHIDFFMHDSEHSYGCMRFEMEAARERMTRGGLIVVDDSRWNAAFADFVRGHGSEHHDLGGGTQIAVTR